MLYIQGDVLPQFYARSFLPPVYLTVAALPSGTSETGGSPLTHHNPKEDFRPREDDRRGP